MRHLRIGIQSALTALLFAVTVSGQGPLEQSVDIYAVALVQAVEEMDRQWSGHEPYETHMPHDFKRPVVAKDRSVVADYPQTSGHRNFEYLRDSELRARRIHLGKDFYVLFVNPARVDGPRVKVVISYDLISLFRSKLFNRKLLRLISSWGIVYFKLDESSGEFQVDEVVLGGI